MQTPDRPMRNLRISGAAVLLLGVAALVIRPLSWSESLSWVKLLAPYSHGAPLPDGFRISDIRCGLDHDVVVAVDRPTDSATIEVHLLSRGRWSGIRESQSFGIGYETPHSSAAEREAITELLAQTIRARDQGLPPPDAIALGDASPASAARSWFTVPVGWRGALLVANLVILASIILVRSQRLALAAVLLGGADLLARAVGVAHVPQETCGDLARAGIVDPWTWCVQIAWATVILASPYLCWRAGRRVGIGGGRLLIAVTVSVALAVAATWDRGDEPLHANGHAWREAREVLAPFGGDAHGTAPFLHGRGSIALEWLLADVELTLSGTANPFRISRVAGAAAAGATAFLGAILVGSPWAGLAAGCVLAVMPLAQALALSGSALAIPAWILPWSLGLLLAAGLSGDRLLLVAAALAAGLGTLSHTAMLAWPPALCAAWLIVAGRGRRFSMAALAAFLLIAIAWVAQAVNCYAMVAGRNAGPPGGLLGEAAMGILHRNLLTDPNWVSPLLLPLGILWLATGLQRGRRKQVGASVLAALVAAPPFFAVTACSSDAVRYQGALLGLATSIAVAGLWSVPFASLLGRAGVALLRAALLGALVWLEPSARQLPIDPTTLEHRLVLEAVEHMAPGTLVVAPQSRFEPARIIFEFPDFLLPEGARVLREGDPAIQEHVGPRLIYLGLACISSDTESHGASSIDMRPECRALRGNARPWFVRSLRPEDLPRGRDGDVWTFQPLAIGVPFGFFAPD